MISEYYYHARERCCVFASTKFQPTTDETYLRMVVDVIMKEACVRPCRNKHNDTGIRLHPLIVTFYP